VMYSLTSETQIAVNWGEVASTQAPGSNIYGYVLEMMDTENKAGTFEVVFDGSLGFPDSRSFILMD